MKFNWGHGITIFILLFMGFIVTLVVKTFQKNADLVREDYYEQEVLFNSKKESIVNFELSGIRIKLNHTPSGFEVSFPANFKFEKGSLLFYRADNKKLDRSFILKLNKKNTLLLNYTNFAVGHYDLSIDWSSNFKNYLFESKVTF